MPFTGSHPAAILPFLGVGLIPSALVIGSIAPDLPYYLGLGADATLTHSARGVVTVDLALGLAAFFVWQVLLAPAGTALAPSGLRARLAPRYPVPWQDQVRSSRAVTLVVVSLLIGAVTHVVWDAFTHADRWGTDHIPWLAETHGALEGYRWMQYLGGIVGGGLVVWVLWRWWSTTPLGAPQRVPALGIRSTVGAGVLVAGAAALGGLAGLLSANDLRNAVFAAVTWGGGGALVAAVVAALWCRWRLQSS